MATIFVSHSGRDNAIVSSLQKWLISNGFDDLFIDFASIRGGDKWSDVLRKEKRACRVVLCIVTDNWLTSDECYGEFSAAFYQGKRIIPLFVSTQAVLKGANATRLARIASEDQGFDVSQAIQAGVFDMDRLPQASDLLMAGLRAAGALVKVGLDPTAFEVDQTTRPSPFPGLESFEDDDADAAIFFGRSPEIERCLEDLREMRANGISQPYAMVGASGSGKSSLMKAGVLPRLRRERGWLPLRAFRPGADPIGNFGTALASTLLNCGETASAGSIRDRLVEAWRQVRVDRFVPEENFGKLRAALDEYFTLLRSRSSRPLATILIALDQGEELVRADAESADILSDYLRAALSATSSEQQPGVPVNTIMVVFTIRSDSLAELQKSVRFAKLDARCADIRPMPLYRFDTAIEGPAARYGVQIDPNLVEAIIDDAPGEDALPLLAFALQRLWSQYHSELRIDRLHYERMGSLGPMIEDAAERALRGLAPGQDEPLQTNIPQTVERLAARTFVPPLTQISDSGSTIRRVAPASRFGTDAAKLIDQFVRWRLLVKKPGPDERSGTVEVAHEVVFRSWLRLQRWIDEEKSRMQVFRDLEAAARLWDQKGRRSNYLDHRGRRLREARLLLKTPEFLAEMSSTQKAYLDGCGTAELKRHVGYAATSAGVLALTFSIVSFYDAISMRGAMRSRADSLIKAGLPTRAAVFALAGKLGETDLARHLNITDPTETLYDTGFSLPLVLDDDEVYSGAKYLLSEDGKRLVTVNGDGAGAIWDIGRGEKLTNLGGNGSVNAYAVTEDQTRIVTQSKDNALSVWDMESGKRLGGSDAATYASAKLTSNPNRLITISESGTALLWNLDTGAQMNALGEANEVENADVIASPPRATIRSRNKQGQLWNTLTGEKIADLGSCEQCYPTEGVPKFLLVGKDGYGQLVSTLDGRLLTVKRIDPGARISGWAFSSDGRRIITRSIYNKLTLWDSNSGDIIADIGVSDSQNYTFSPSGQQILLRYTNSSGELRSSADGSLLVAFPPGELSEYKFSKVRDRLATIALNLSASLWNSATGKKMATLADPGVADSVSFSRDGSRLSVGSSKGLGGLWDSENGSKITDYPRPATDAAGGGEFSQDGTRFVTSGGDNFGMLWDARTGAYLADLGGEGAVSDGEVSADGRRIATNSVFSTVAVWDGSRLPLGISPMNLREYVCAINHTAIQTFSGAAREGAYRLDNVDISVSQYIRGRPWHPCDWRGLSTMEGWAQSLRYWVTKMSGHWDYKCGERTAFGGIDKEATKLCDTTSGGRIRDPD